jgi:hypothetical protein
MKIRHGRLGMVAAAAFSLVANCLHAQVNVTTYHYDVARTGQNTQETILTPSNVNASTFGKLFSVAVDGYVFAQPLYLSNVTISGGTHNVVYVATEHDSLYAIDADNGTVYWHLSLIPAGGSTVNSITDLNCTDLVPEVGITGTPVIDSNSGTIYLVAKSKVGGNIVQYLHAIDVVKATEKFGAPIAIHASVTGSGAGAVGGILSFAPQYEHQRESLLLDKDSEGNSHVVIGWGSHCDIAPWHGWMMSYNAATLAQEAAFNSSPNGYGNGIWQSGAAPAADSAGNIYFATGNGTWNGTTDFGDSIVKLGPPSGGAFPVLDYFTPYDQATLAANDSDVASGGLILLPAATNGKQQIVLQAKDGTLFNLDSGNLGKYCVNKSPPCTTGDTQISQEVFNATVGVWGAPAYWNGSVYWAGADDNGGRKDFMKAFGVNPATDLLTTTPTSQTAQSFGFSAPVPVVSANGKTNGIVWGLDDSQYMNSCSGATDCQVLYAYDATNLANLLYSSQQAANFRDVPGSAVKFATPIVANGKVYVGSRYSLAVYGLLTATPAATPVFSPAAGAFTSAQSVTIKDATAGSTIHYTTNGTTPTTASAVYSASIPVSATTTINALAVAPGYGNSPVATATYTIGTGAATPVDITLPSPTVDAIAKRGTSVPGGGLDGAGDAYDSSLLGASLTWSGVTFDLGAPGVADAITSTTIPIAANNYSTLYLLGTAVGGNQPGQSFVVTYTDGTTTTFTQGVSNWNTPQSYPGESIALGMADRVTSNGSLDTRTFNLYGYSFALNPAKTVQSFKLPANKNVVVLAVALKPASSVTPTAATPVFSPAAGSFASAQSVTVTDATAGSKIYYTTNGTTPTTASTLYTGAIAVSATTTIKALAVATGDTNSAVASATYTIGTVATTPVDITLASPTVYAIANRGTAVPGGGLDGAGDAYDSSLLGSTLTWSGVKFDLGAPQVADAITSSTVTIAAHTYSTVYLLGTAVGGNQPAQAFVVTYTDGTTTTFTQGVSNWNTPQSYPGESIALGMADRVKSTGSLDQRTFNLYGYSFALNPAKSVQSLKLPANKNVIVLAIALKE